MMNTTLLMLAPAAMNALVAEFAVVWLATTTYAISSKAVPAVRLDTSAVTTEFQLLPYW